MSALYSQLPAIDRLLRTPALQVLSEQYGRALLTRTLRQPQALQPLLDERQPFAANDWLLASEMAAEAAGCAGGLPSAAQRPAGRGTRSCAIAAIVVTRSRSSPI